MDKNNEKKNKVLGIPYGTACGRLRKALLFNLVQETSKDICYRCKKKIDNIKDFSIDHKVPWENNNADLFWDYNNIAYSHLSCNVAAAISTKEVGPFKHGTKRGYSTVGCRCDLCKEYQKKSLRKYRASL